MIKDWVKSKIILLVAFSVVIIFNLLLLFKFQEYLSIANILLIILYLYKDYDYYRFKNLMAIKGLEEATDKLAKTLRSLFSDEKDDEDDDKKN